MNKSESLINVTYQANGKSVLNNILGMREMQAKVFEKRDSRFLLVKAPPASGKSRALMFVALDKLNNQHIKKVIIAVPERSIGKSFESTKLTTTGFYWDWEVQDIYNLCNPGGFESKVNLFKRFLKDDSANTLICTHSTLRFAFDKIGDESFNSTFVGVDEFHHVSADYESRLGELVRALMTNCDAHIMAMTGSYFRGDAVPVLMPEDEAKFTTVTYNYYEQLNGYKYLKSLGIGFYFYDGKYETALIDVIDTKKKTIIYIPNVNSSESTKDKYLEVDMILDKLGVFIGKDNSTNIISIETNDGKILKVADLVNDDATERNKVVQYLRGVQKLEDIDIIIALGMAKEGFDWSFCEHTLTIGYRGSLTEIVQIIGRCTRDSANKTHAQFTNLIAQPDGTKDEIVESVNNMLKAISASLLMEQIIAPKFIFKSKGNENLGTIVVGGLREPTTDRTKNILENDLTELKASILQNEEIQKALTGVVDTEVVNKVMIPKIIMTKYPDLNEVEVEEVRQNLITDMVLRSSVVSSVGNNKFIQMAGSFINIEDLNIDLIDNINPFQNAFEILSKSIDTRILKAIETCIKAYKISMTDDEAFMLWPKINEFVKKTQREPSLDSLDLHEKRMAEALAYLRALKASRNI